MKAIPNIQIINGIISFRSDILGGKKDKEGPPYVCIGWNYSKQFIAIVHVRKSIRYGLMPNGVETHIVRLDRDFVDKLKCLRDDLMDKERTEIINEETGLFEE